jgi:hypothetical protein
VRLTGSLAWLFLALGVALVAYASMLLAASASGVWFREQEKSGRRGEPCPTRVGAGFRHQPRSAVASSAP